MSWLQSEAVGLCRTIEAICPEFGCHVALTGGLLYKDGARKDCDILFYRIRQVEAIDTEGLITALANIGVAKTGGFGWCHKAEYEGKPIDMFFPEDDGGEYEKADPQDAPEFLPDFDLPALPAIPATADPHAGVGSATSAARAP